MLFLMCAIEVGFLVLCTALGAIIALAVNAGWFSALAAWIGEDNLDKVGENLNRAAKKVEPMLEEAIREGMTFAQPLVFAAGAGLIIALLYRMDVRIWEEKEGRVVVGKESFEVAEPIEIGWRKVREKTGPAVKLPAFPQVAKAHLKAARESVPVYSLVGLSVFVALLALLPLALAPILPAETYERDSPRPPKDVNSVLELTSALVGGLAAPWAIALAVGLVSVARGQGKLVWNYREVWGENKAEGVIVETRENREKKHVVLEHEEVETV